ncbi:MAG: LysR family transcriptional regulator [Caulobacter sp.]|nr:LysR family transcriptional regulator [Caulobacter sp.]
MDFSTLEIFAAVASEGGVTRAAGRLGRAQSNISTRLRDLEAELGRDLFRRDGKRMLLTAEGEVFLGYANHLLSVAAEARGAVVGEVSAGRLRLGAMESTAAARLPEPLAKFHADYPHVDLQLTTGTTQAIIDQVLDHRLDVGLVAAAPGSLAGSGVTAEPIWAEDLMLILPRDHPAALSASDVRVGAFAAFEFGCAYRRIGEAWLAGGRAERPMRVLELGSYHAIIACVAAGAAAAVVPRALLELAATPPPVRTTPLQRIETVLISRSEYRSPLLDALRGALAASSNLRARAGAAAA